MNGDYGRVRVYECRCGVCPVRPAKGDPMPCEVCGRSLVGCPHEIHGLSVYTRLVAAEVLTH